MIHMGMVPNCLKDFIGIKCLVENPTSGYYINDLEGLNLKYASDIVDSDHVSGLQFIRSKIDFATSIVLNEITKYSLPFFRINSIISTIVAGEFTSSYLAPVASNRGLQLKIRESKLLRIRIRAIHIKIQQSNFTHSVQIVDGLNSTSYPFTTDSNGDATIYCEYLSQTDTTYVVMDDSAINVNNSDVKSGCGCSSKSVAYLTANGWNGTNISNSSYGIRIEANAECSQNEIGCILSSRLGLPILYRSGYEIAKEALTSDRLNSITLLDSEKTEFMVDAFQKEYENQMKILVQTLPLIMKRIDDCCIMCNQSQYVQAIP